MQARRLMFDIGAHVGQSARNFLGHGFKVVSVEANPEACRNIRQRLSSYVEEGQLVVEEKALWREEGTRIDFYVNEEDSEWSSVFQAVGGRFDTDFRVFSVETCTMSSLYEKYGRPDYIKIDIEGGDEICLQQLQGLAPPEILSFECNSFKWVEMAADLGYDAFKLVPQSAFLAQDVEWSHRVWHSGPEGEEAVNVCGDQSWCSKEELEEQIRERFVIHSSSGLDEFLQSARPFMQHDFAVLQAVFPIEAKDEQEWYDVYCTKRRKRRRTREGAEGGEKKGT
eukprot:755212-Hanusia_phi.AAC.1